MKIMTVVTCIVLALFSATLISSCKGGGQKDLHPEVELPADNLRLLTGRAALIFKGVVSGLEYETDTHTGLPFTYVTFRQIEAIKDLSGKFISGKQKKLRVRLLGGVKEDGTMTVTSHIPSFTLGAVYVVFYTGGEWNISPIVGGENGVFQVVKSRTLGHEMLLDYHGHVVVEVAGDSLRTLALVTGQGHAMREAENQDKVVVKQTDRINVDPNSIYTEQGVEQMIAGKEAQISFEKEEASTGQQETPKSLMLKSLSTSPMSFEAFCKGVLEVDKKYAGEFHKFYSKVHLEGKIVERERTPLKINQN